MYNIEERFFSIDRERTYLKATLDGDEPLTLLQRALLNYALYKNQRHRCWMLDYVRRNQMNDWQTMLIAFKNNIV